MGRRAKSIDLAVIQGGKHYTKKEIQKRQKNEQNLKVASNKIRPPKWLSKEAKKEFRKLVKELEVIELLTNIDVHTLAVYCDAVVKYAEATQQLDEEGLTTEYTNKAGATNTIQHPAVGIATKYATIIRQFCTEFGFSPSSRAKLAINKEVKAKDPFEEKFGDA